jgi:D-glucosaminate-6-phosphate ammonia-lyase
MSIYESLGVRPIINARGFSTKLGGCVLPEPVLDTMRDAARACVRMDELQEAAGRVIAEVTGAESGIVTSGASAALTLAAAACMAGLDVSRMNSLPDTSGMPNEIVVHRSHRNDYDHALRTAGARFVEVGFTYYTFPYEVEQAIGPRTAALFYQAGGAGVVMSLEEFAAIAHARGVPVIVDAAAELPPKTNLRNFISAGADLVAFSGGKHIRGPQCTGILCGRSDLILSAALQHQDMDVFPSTWPLRSLMASGRISGPPHHGIGRGFKVGKEEIAGLVTALRMYASRDIAAELKQWEADMRQIADAAAGLPGVRAWVEFPQPNGRQVPHTVVRIDEAVAGRNAAAVINALQSGNPPIYVFEQAADQGLIRFMPEGLRDGEAAIIAQRLAGVLRVEKGAWHTST